MEKKNHHLFVFFGQITRTKGINILLEAAKRLREAGVAFQLGIHGTLALQEQSRRARLEADFAEAAPLSLIHI